jgi:hypothetical protein
VSVGIPRCPYHLGAHSISLNVRLRLDCKTSTGNLLFSVNHVHAHARVDSGSGHPPVGSKQRVLGSRNEIVYRVLQSL